MQPLHSQGETNCVIPAQDLQCVQAKSSPHSPPVQHMLCRLTLHCTVCLLASSDVEIEKEFTEATLTITPENDFNRNASIKYHQSSTVCQRTSSPNQRVKVEQLISFASQWSNTTRMPVQRQIWLCAGQPASSACPRRYSKTHKERKWTQSEGHSLI